MKSKEIEKDQLTKYQLLVQLKTLYKIVDKLENRISSLEKVLSSHAKCIGELRGTELRIHDLKDNQFEINADGTETTKDSIL